MFRQSVSTTCLARGATNNLRWLQQHVRNHVFERLDITSAAEMDDLVRRHADAKPSSIWPRQTAVTTSVDTPRRDFEANALGTLNILEAVRQRAPSAAGVVRVDEQGVWEPGARATDVRRVERYEFVRRPHGITESCPLDFHSPYGCSKGAADQYVRDYARIYGMRTLRLPAVMHLRAAAVRLRRTGLGGMVRHRCRDRRADHGLRRRLPGARPAVDRRSVRAVSTRDRAHRQRQRQRLQHRRGTGERASL